ncbi:low molecular weight protein tyrosine phosphatase [Halalkalibacter wakoensis JCM 9140]|uniref:Low molecular weight protein tyrosine phosphatase n=1 Tax=Halalkalibacter wakoensis JCM 9140 TaxID=1236970 RepID=W4Q763_9BACI|nr:low molecular weight protein arginine phosphatase [Halalkalibacter wakoensis]GAE27224.1 low molecular weight protein tyrosine phosphatase [Halalkalibacter wakoensis JCM 9140]
MKKVLFVCTGNTCRSPMAEALLRSKFGETVQVKSAGVQAYPNSPASEGTKAVLAEKGIEFDHLSQPVTDELLHWADIVLTMTNSHKEMIKIFYPHVNEKLFTLKEYVDPQSDDIDIADPIGGPIEAYRQTAEQIEQCLKKASHKFTE